MRRRTYDLHDDDGHVVLLRACPQVPGHVHVTVPPEDQFGPTLRLHFDAEQAQQLRELLTIVCEEAAERAGGE